MKQLPTGLQVFETIRKRNALYVDKTDIIYEWVSGIRKQFFLSRPRRFDKSLLCWTLDALFRGKRELFEGLAISKADWTWESYPVIHLNMGMLCTINGVDGVRDSLIQYTKSIADEHEIDLHGTTEPVRMLERIYVGAAKKYGKPAVVIIDEYDTPFLDFYDKPPSAQDVRHIMMNYYSWFKSNEPHIRFLFMTGISKFTQDWVSSSRNNIYDMSLDKEFGTLLGYTEKELVENFGEYLDDGAKKLNISVDELTEKIRTYYYGFCFDGTNQVYCPSSMLSFFENYLFLDHWMNSGSTTVIANYMKDRNLTVEQFRGLQISRDFARMPGEIETARPESFLYQAGYLTLREGSYDDFSLDYPNTEVLNSMSQLVYKNMLQSNGGQYTDLYAPLVQALYDGNSKLLVDIINDFLVSIPYDDYTTSAKQGLMVSGLKITTQEWLYRSNILALLRGCGVLTFGEMHNSKGRSDLLVSYADNTWVIEIKVAYNDDCKTKAAEALKQIDDNQYADPYKSAKKLGIAIDDKTRRVGEWVEG